MDKREFNTRLNGLKDAYPSELALIEGIQDLFNKKIEVISKSNAHALIQNPTQFITKIATGNGEWTTQMHIWAENLVPELLQLDPRMLTAKDSAGRSVLHAMVDASTGKFTQMMNYDYIQDMLNKNMSYMYLEVPNDPASKMEGNAWMEVDAYGRTPMDYLVDIANGEETGMQDTQLSLMLSEFSASPADEIPVDNTPEIPADQMVDPVTGQPVQPGMQQPTEPGEYRGDSGEAQSQQPEQELTSLDNTTVMQKDPGDPDDPGTPTQQNAEDNQSKQVSQAQDELKKQPDPMLEALLCLFK